MASWWGCPCSPVTRYEKSGEKTTPFRVKQCLHTKGCFTRLHSSALQPWNPSDLYRARLKVLEYLRNGTTTNSHFSQWQARKDKLKDFLQSAPKLHFCARHKLPCALARLRNCRLVAATLAELDGIGLPTFQAATFGREMCGRICKRPN